MKMLQMFSTVLVGAALVAAGTPSYGQADAHDHAGHDHAGHDHAGHDHGGETLDFYLPQWKSLHFNDTAKATKHFETVKKLGCEVKQGNHAGHIDVTYRCPAWKTLAVKDHAMADQWSGWLKASGFDVSHSHLDPAFAEGPEAVEFRMVKWKQLHGDGSPAEVKMVKQLQRVGCEVVVENHGNHKDIRFRAPTWRDIHLTDHAVAEQWIAWLNHNGFETHHEH